MPRANVIDLDMTVNSLDTYSDLAPVAMHNYVTGEVDVELVAAHDMEMIFDPLKDMSLSEKVCRLVLQLLSDMNHRDGCSCDGAIVNEEMVVPRIGLSLPFAD